MLEEQALPKESSPVELGFAVIVDEGPEEVAVVVTVSVDVNASCNAD